MRVDQFDFDLPDDCIALRPVAPRDAARMLVVRPGATPELSDAIVRDLVDLLQPGDCLVFNNTKVIPAELSGVRLRGETRAGVQFNLHKREGANLWRAFARGAKKLALDDRILFGDEPTACDLVELWATVTEKGEGGDILLAFDLAGPALDERIHALGRIPLPPYIGTKRAADERDLRDYQTIYARDEGAVAAPTAGLHFTPELIQRLTAHGIGHQFVTLHVGAGTFLPVKAEDTDDHRMHAEWGLVTTRGGHASERDAGARWADRRCRHDIAAPPGKRRRCRWDHPSLRNRDRHFITPGKSIRAVDVLMTNFHLPKSTLFMLVSAFSGFDCMRRAYAHAVAEGYRFYSYGDASLLFRATQP